MAVGIQSIDGNETNLPEKEIVFLHEIRRRQIVVEFDARRR